MSRWGFVGAGGIAATVARDLALTEGAEALAVGSRNLTRARSFAAEHGFERAYGSYAELFADDDVDVVYVATPHAQHHAVARPAMEAGRAVLVEKSFTVSSAAAVDLVAVARERGVFAMEAMWTRFLPLVRRLVDVVADGAIGEVRVVQADFGFPGPADGTDRLWDPAQGGGAMLDLGVYPVSFAHLLLGPPSTVQVTGSLAATGVDADAGVLLGWDGGAHAALSCSLTSRMSGAARVVGTRGRVEVLSPFHHPPAFVLHRDGAEPEQVTATTTGRGYAHMLGHVQDCLAAGLTESPVMPLGATLQVMAVLDTALDRLGAVHVDEGFPPPA